MKDGKKMLTSDDDLIAQIRRGDEKAAEELIKRYYTAIMRYCRQHCLTLEKAEDLTQEVFLKLFQNIAGYTGRGKFKAYLYTIANHICVNESRRRQAYFLTAEAEESLADGKDEMRGIEDRSEIRYLLSCLSSEQREAVILRFGEQLSLKEIAEVTGCNMRTVQSRIRSALKIMKGALENER